MNKYISFTVLSIYTFIVGIGCNKYLDVNPDSRSELTTSESVSELLSTAYPQGSYVVFAENMSDNNTDKGVFSSSTVTATSRDPYRFNPIIESKESDSPDFYWASCYKAIAAANEALSYIEKKNNASEFLPYKGEALVCRAYSHFMLGVFYARTYGDNGIDINPGIPYVKENEDVVIKKYDRGTVKSLYENIQKDLEDGIKLISDGAYKNEEARPYHFTKVSAYAFATRFYLFKQEYDSVIKYAQLAFPGNTIANSLRDINAYSPLPYYSLQQKYTSISEPCNLLLNVTQSSIGDNYWYYRYGPSDRFVTVFMKQTPPNGGSYAWNIYGQPNIYNIPKYRSYTTQNIRYTVNILFSAEEVLFNWAEALVKKGDYAGALALINIYLPKKSTNSSSVLEITLKTIFGNANVTQPSTYYMEALLNFKRREYAFEGMRWMDMIRHRIPSVHSVIESPNLIEVGADDPRRILQIPAEAQQSGIQLNPR